MGKLTSSLVIRLQDDVSARALRAAGALKQLAASGDGLKRLGGATAGLDRVAQRLAALKGRLEALGQYRAAGRGLLDLGLDLRKAKADLAAADALLRQRRDVLDRFAAARKADPARYAAAQQGGLIDGAKLDFRAAQTARTKAARAADRAQGAYDRQRAGVQEMRARVLPNGGPVSRLVGAEGEWSIFRQVPTGRAVRRPRAECAADRSSTPPRPLSFGNGPSTLLAPLTNINDANP